MSWDIFAQNIPADVSSLDEIPDDFQPTPIASRDQVLTVIARVAPFADVSDTTWIRIDNHDADIEISLPTADPVTGFVFHVRGGDASVGIIAAVLGELRCRAFDPGASGGLFDDRSAQESLRRWLQYRDRVLAKKPP